MTYLEEADYCRISIKTSRLFMFNVGYEIAMPGRTVIGKISVKYKRDTLSVSLTYKCTDPRKKHKEVEKQTVRRSMTLFIPSKSSKANTVYITM